MTWAWLSRTSSSAPTLTIEQAVEGGALWHRATEETTYPLPGVTNFGDVPLPVQTFYSTTVPERGVLELRRATVSGAGGWVFDRRGRSLPDLTWFGSDYGLIPEAEAPPHVDRNAPRIRGRSLVLLSTWGEHFGHFVPDVVGRLAVTDAAGVDLSLVDSIIIPAHRSEEGERTIERLGLGGHRLVRLHNGEQLRLDIARVRCRSW